MADKESQSKRPRRSRLTLVERLAKEDRAIATFTRKLDAAKKRRASIIASEATKAQNALDEVNKARAFEQTTIPGTE